jgi:hypothetical protein
MSTLFLVWKGIDDNNIWMTQPNNLSVPFPTQAPLPANNAITTSRPAIITFGEQVIVAFAQPGTGVVSCCWNYVQPNQGWLDPIGVLGGAGTSWAPAMALFQNTVIMVWPGVGSDTRIWCSRYNPATNQFGEQYVTVLGPKYNFGAIQSGSTPAIVNWNGTLLMVWRGEGSNDNLYFSFSSDGVNWSDQGQILGAASTIQPALTIWQGLPYLVFRGGTNDDSIRGTFYKGQPGGTEWVYGDEASLGPFGTSHGAGITVFNGNLFMTWKGTPGDTDLYWSQAAPNSGYTGQAVISGVGSSVGPSVTAY